MRSELCIHDLGTGETSRPADAMTGSSRRRTGTPDGFLLVNGGRAALPGAARRAGAGGGADGAGDGAQQRPRDLAGRADARDLGARARRGSPASTSCRVEGGEPRRVTRGGAVLVAWLVAGRGAARLCRRAAGGRAGVALHLRAWTGRTRSAWPRTSTTSTGRTTRRTAPGSGSTGSARAGWTCGASGPTGRGASG